MHRLKDDGLIKRELEILDGLNDLVLSRRRAIYAESQNGIQHGLLKMAMSEWSKQLSRQNIILPPDVAVPRQTRLHYATLRAAYLNDFLRHRHDLEMGLESIAARRSLSVDHTRAGASISMNNKLGYWVALISDEGLPFKDI